LQNLPTLEQVPPPLFGEAPSGSEQPLTPAPIQQRPNIEQSPQTVTPEITQDDNNGGEGGLPSIKDRVDLPLYNEITEQPEVDGEQGDSSEGAETAGPLT
jgi:hypothetical protein